MLHVRFKETALLLTMHLGCFVNFILCLTDKYMFKDNKLNWQNLKKILRKSQASNALAVIFKNADFF